MVSDTTPTLTRRQQQRQATITDILDAARAQMRRDGAAALNLNEVARQVGLRPPSLYEYFPGGKHAIYDALFRLGFTLFGQSMRSADEYDDVASLLQQTMDTYLRFAVEHPELYQICFERPVPGFVPSEESLRLSFGQLADARGTVERVLAQADNPLDLTVEQVRDLTIALMHGLAALHLANEPHLPPGEGRFGSLIPAATAVLSRALSVAPPSVPSAAPLNSTAGEGEPP
jgi:AcrR family transcriptional regulator